jgi:hypothetical protein
MSRVALEADTAMGALHCLFPHPPPAAVGTSTTEAGCKMPMLPLLLPLLLLLLLLLSLLSRQRDIAAHPEHDRAVHVPLLLTGRQVKHTAQYMSHSTQHSTTRPTRVRHLLYREERCIQSMQAIRSGYQLHQEHCSKARVRR